MVISFSFYPSESDGFHKKILAIVIKEIFSFL